VTGGQLLNQYLAVIGKECGDTSKAQLARGQFHDVVLLGEVAYRFPRDEESRRLLPARAELLGALGNSQLPVAIPGLLSKSAVGQPLGRCHVALRRLSGGPIQRARIVGPLAEGAVVSGLARVLDRLGELGADEAVRNVVLRSDPRRWERFAADVSNVLFPLMSGKGRERAWTSTELGPRLTGILDWDEVQIGSQADDLASIAVTVGWPIAMRIDAQRHGDETPTIATARAIAATFALQQALPAALNGDAASLADGLSTYRDLSPAGLWRSLCRPRTVAAPEGRRQRLDGRHH
jgi:hypothetical protein